MYYTICKIIADFRSRVLTAHWTSHQEQKQNGQHKCDGMVVLKPDMWDTIHISPADACYNLKYSVFVLLVNNAGATNYLNFWEFHDSHNFKILLAGGLITIYS